MVEMKEGQGRRPPQCISVHAVKAVDLIIEGKIHF